MSKKPAEAFEYRIKQDGMIVASVYSTDFRTAYNEIQHYAVQYELDRESGPVVIEKKENGRWKKV